MGSVRSEEDHLLSSAECCNPVSQWPCRRAFLFGALLDLYFGVWLNLSPSRRNSAPTRINTAHAWTDGPPPATFTVR